MEYFCFPAEPRGAKETGTQMTGVVHEDTEQRQRTGNLVAWPDKPGGDYLKVKAITEHFC